MKCIAPVLEKAGERGQRVELILRAMSKATTNRGRRVWNFDIKGRVIDKGEKINALPVGRGAIEGDKQLPARA
jgi:hypothetical protein